MEHLVIAWYAWLSSLTQGSALRLQGWADAVHLPMITAAMLGLIGAMSPCQLTTNLGALAYASARPGRARPFALAAAYVAGKVTIYSLAGAAVVVAGLELRSMSIPVIIAARRALGPLMLVIGVAMIAERHPRFSFGHRLALAMRGRWQARGALGAYALGMAFAFAFCPTLFWLFFGLTIPLALGHTGGWSFAGVFAVGSSLPLLVVTGLVDSGVAALDRVTGGMKRLERPLRMAAGALLLLAGLHDTIVYWLL